MTEEVDPDYHSPLSPSSAHRWRLCPGSINAERGLPDQVGEEARQGTCFHAVAAECLEFGVDPWPYIGTMIDIGRDGEREFTEEMASKMMPGLIQLRALEDIPDAKMYVEKRVSLDDWVLPGESGTADDFIIDVHNWRIINWDWKWGAGVPVQPEWNDQTILYTLGVWSDYGQEAFEQELIKRGGNPNDPWEEDIEVVICIEQPRAPGGGGTWKTTMGALLREGAKIRADAEATLDPDAPRFPGEKQCKFCKAARANTCKERRDLIVGLLGFDVDDLETELEVGTPVEIVDRRALSPEARSQILLHKSMITDFLSQLHDEAMEDAAKGRPVPGMKRVPGRRPPRKWKDELRTEMLLMADMRAKAYQPPKLKSPTNVEDDVGKKVYRDRYAVLVEEGEPSPVLVPESDPREPIQSALDLLDDDDSLM